MALLNSSFQDGGVSPGDAAHWTLRTFVARERIAGFGPQPYRAYDDFERWFELRLGFEDGDLALALFDPLAEGLEDFEEAWGNDAYQREFPLGQSEACSFGGGPVESFAQGWANDNYTIDWDNVTPVTGLFDGEPYEDFAEQWANNQSYAWSWTNVTSATAMFDGGAQAVEDYENGWTAALTI